MLRFKQRFIHLSRQRGRLYLCNIAGNTYLPRSSNSFNFSSQKFFNKREFFYLSGSGLTNGWDQTWVNFFVKYVGKFNKQHFALNNSKQPDWIFSKKISLCGTAFRPALAYIYEYKIPLPPPTPKKKFLPTSVYDWFYVVCYKYMRV